MSTVSTSSLLRTSIGVIGALVLLAGCSSTVGGSAVAGTTPPVSGSPSPTTSASSDTSTESSVETTTSNSETQSPIPPVPPTVTTSAAPITPTSSTSSASVTTSAPVTTSTPPASTPTTPTSGGGAGPADPFAGATAVDPSAFTGTVTPVGFSSPSGNIACGFQPTKTPAVVCQIEHHTYPNPSQDCHGAGAPGAALTLSAGGAAEFLCAGDVEGGGPTLAYGSMIKVSGLECVSRESGVTCRDTATGNGFRVSTASYELTNGGHTAGASAAATTASSFSRFTGTWGGHGRSLDVTAAGRATVTYRSYVWCSDNPNPPCDSMTGGQIVAGGKITITLTAAGGSTGTGTITASDDPAYPTGKHVTATVSGYNLTLSIWPDGPFCAANTPPAQWNCGA